MSHYLDLSLSGTVRSSLLEHLFVLLPVLDDDKHYWVGATRSTSSCAGGRLASGHPDRDLITRRYLRHDRRLTEALVRLMEDDTGSREAAAHDSEEAAVERPLRLNEQRLAAVVDAVRGSGARRVLDLGCGAAKLMRRC